MSKNNWKDIIDKDLGYLPKDEAHAIAKNISNENRGSWKYLSRLSYDSKVLIYPCGNQAGMVNIARSCKYVVVCSHSIERLKLFSKMAVALNINNIFFINLDEKLEIPLPSDFFQLVFFPIKFANKLYVNDFSILSEFNRVLDEKGQLYIVTRNCQPHKIIKNYLKLFLTKKDKPNSKSYLEDDISLSNFTSIGKWRANLINAGFPQNIFFQREQNVESLKELNFQRKNHKFYVNWKFPEIAILAEKNRGKSFWIRLLESLGIDNSIMENYHISLMGNVKIEINYGLRQTEKGLLILPSTDVAKQFMHRGIKTVDSILSDNNISESIKKFIPGIKEQGIFENQLFALYDWMPGESGFSSSSHFKQKNIILEKGFIFLDGLFQKLIKLSSEELYLYIKSYVDNVSIFCDRKEDQQKLEKIVDYIIKSLKDIQIPISYLHGDFSAHNIVFKKDSLKMGGVIDWEFGAVSQIGLIDYFQFIFSINSNYSPEYIGDRVSRHLKSVSFSPWVEKSFDMLFYKKGIETKYFRSFVLIYWLHSVSRQSSFNFNRYFDLSWKKVNIYQVLDSF